MFLNYNGTHPDFDRNSHQLPIEVCLFWSAIGHTDELIHILPPSQKRNLFSYGYVKIAHVLPSIQERNMDIFSCAATSHKRNATTLPSSTYIVNLLMMCGLIGLLNGRHLMKG